MTTEVTRYYYRCPLCLTALTLEERREDVRCVCGGRLRLLGPVEHNRWLRQEDRPACDARCISATGPNCDCQCGGVNHGRGVMATVYFDGGAAVARPVHPEEAIRRAEEYRAAVRAVEQALAAKYGDETWETFRAGGYIRDRGTWEALRWWTRELDDARGLLVHKRRITRLQDLATRIREGRFYR